MPQIYDWRLPIYERLGGVPSIGSARTQATKLAEQELGVPVAYLQPKLVADPKSGVGAALCHRTP